MIRRRWTTEDDRLLVAAYPDQALALIAEWLGRTKKAIKSRAKLLRVRRAGRRPWAAPEIATLRRLYPDTPTAQIADQLERPLHCVYSQAAKLGLHKSQAYRDSPAACRLRRGDNVGAAFRYPKGHVPANKGMRRPGWAPGRMRETQFKKGRPAHEARNYLPIGSLRLSKVGYLERKVTDDQSIVPARRWVSVHRLVWEAEHGPVPAGHALTFLPGRRTAVLEEISVDGLELITRQELMRRNSIHNYPPQLRANMVLLGRVRKAIERKDA